MGLVFTPVFFFIGVGVYRIYYESFERKDDEALRGLAFFFGVMFIIEVGLIMAYGVDFRTVQAPYIGQNWKFGGVGVPTRMFVPFCVSLAMFATVHLYLSRTFNGRAIMAVAQDRLALQLMAADPVRIKQLGFGIGIGTAALAGALLIIIIPIEPSIGRLYIGQVFAIAVLAGLGSIPGTLVAAIVLGIAESLVATFFGPSWAPAVAFGILLLALAFRPQGLFGR